MKTRLNKTLQVGILASGIIVLSIFTSCNQDNKTPDHQSINMDKKQTDSSIVRNGIIDLKMIDANKDGMVYQDPMDWNVISDMPGKCPLCNMTLKEVTLEKAKENLWLHQTKNNSLILNYDDPTSRRLGTKTSGTVYYYSLEKDVFSCKDKENNIWLENKKVGNAKELKLIGPHNQYNALAALIASTRAGTDPTIAWKAICKFEGLEHRLETVAEIDNVLFINDSFATNPEPTLAAIRSFSKPIILILGGSSKGADFTKMAEEISNSNVRGVILIGDEAKKIEEDLKKVNFKGEIKTGLTKMQEIVAAAKKIAQEGDVVILSPACASFGLFKDYKDRGKQFKEEVIKLKNSPPLP